MLKLPWTRHRPSDGAAYRRVGADVSDAARRLPPLDLHGATLRRVDLSGTDLEGANFVGTDFTDANLRGSNFKNANLKGAILRGTDLREVENLTRAQLSEAVTDETTMLPGYLANDAARLQSEADRQGHAS
jgi:uncharacterized protein YjbI with pentapeptide repeats